jgi:hypothetical protein
VPGALTGGVGCGVGAAPAAGAELLPATLTWYGTVRYGQGIKGRGRLGGFAPTMQDEVCCYITSDRRAYVRTNSVGRRDCGVAALV